MQKNSIKLERNQKYGLVLTGGGTRAAYQVGVLKALYDSAQAKEIDWSVVVGTSIGGVNGVVFSAAYKKGFSESINALEKLWYERTFGNSFGGPLTMTLLRSIRIGFLQYLSPGPKPTTSAIFDPTPLRQCIDELLFSYGGATVSADEKGISAIGVMATQEGDVRKGVLLVNSRDALNYNSLDGIGYDVHYVNHLSSSHAFASAALPFVLPPVEMEIKKRSARLVDGGIADNFPIDSAVRFGAEKVVIIDTSGRRWWSEQLGQEQGKQYPWEPKLPKGSFCFTPDNLNYLINQEPFGPVLKDTIGSTTKDYIHALGPTWPIYKLLKNKMGEELALETMTYAVIHPPFIRAVIERGYQETSKLLG